MTIFIIRRLPPERIRADLKRSILRHLRAHRPTGSLTFAEGDRVRHKKFGDGTVAEAQAVGNDMRLKIIFDESGEKNLMAVYAKLEKISE